jgi:heavy metal translocating P-type ATPase
MNFADHYRRYGAVFYAAVATLGLAVGSALWATGFGDWSGRVWTLATVPPLAALVVQIVMSLRAGDVGLDAIAFLSMSAALLFGEPLAANVVALMYSGGQLLEAFAAGRAQREMTALLGRVATTAMRLEHGGATEIPVDSIAPGDRLLIRKGEVLSVDGRVAHHTAILDLAALTGEFQPVSFGPGDDVMSGATSVGEAFELIATRPAADSTYAGIVALVEAARKDRPPVQRLADRYALAFLVLTLLIAGGAWFATGDPIRALSVLVVATPCPLILAVPVAMISGLSRSARMGVLIKGGRALEALTRIRTAVLDKTGTLTEGQAAVTDATLFGPDSEAVVVAAAASLDQASGHVLAAALVREAQRRGLALSIPTEVSESAGSGITGLVGGRRIALGGRSYVAQAMQIPPAALPPAVFQDGSTNVWVGIDGKMAAVLQMADRIRVGADKVLLDLRAAGVSRIVLASGDRHANAAAVGARLAVDEVIGDLAPADKVELVKRETALAPVMMVGDGVNDAPSLAAATVGVAMGARGAAASSEAADVVVLVDRLDPVVAAIQVARRSMSIAYQSVYAGIGLSIIAMIAAAFGFLPPVTGALVQEVIDVGVILNALRALR